MPHPGNHLAICRIHCATGAWAAAEQLVATSLDPAAAYHLARLYEAQERVEDAIKYYTQAGRPARGAGLAKRCVVVVTILLKWPVGWGVWGGMGQGG